MATYTFSWNPYDATDPGPRIPFSVARFAEEIEDGRRIGLEYAASPCPIALIDTGSPFTIVNKVLARSSNLHLSNPTFLVNTMNGPCDCEEYCGSISFPGTGLPTLPSIQILARDLPPATTHACLLGRNVLRRWDIRFDGKNRKITIIA